MKNQKEWICAAVRCRFSVVRIFNWCMWLIDWLVGSSIGAVSVRLTDWLSWAGFPPPTRFWSFWCQYISLDVLSSMKMVFGRKNQNLRSYRGFCFRPINQSINRHTPFICMLTAGIMQMNGWAIDWLINWFDSNFFILPFLGSPFSFKVPERAILWFLSRLQMQAEPVPGHHHLSQGADVQFVCEMRQPGRSHCKFASRCRWLCLLYQ